MKWLELSVKAPWEFVEPISYLFNRYGRGFSMEDPEADQVLLRTYLPSRAKAALARIDVGVRLVAQLAPAAELAVVELKQEDWETAWRAHFGLLRVGQRLVIRPSWVEYEPAAGELVINLDPGMAFGTGYHPTTRLCLASLESHVRPGMAVLDLGSGSGILAVTAALLGAGTVLGLDSDPKTLKVARNNCRDNGLGRTVRLAGGTLPHERAPAQAFDLVVANISARVLQEKACHILEVLRPGGTLLASGVVRHQAEGLAGTLQEVGFLGIATGHLDDWASITASKGS